MRIRNVEIEVAPQPQAVAERAAERVVSAAGECIRDRGRFTLALSGGSTPRLFHEVLSSRHRDAIDWTKVIILFSDDRAVPPIHKDSNYRMTEETLLSRVPIPSGNVHRIEADDGDHKRAAKEYEQAIIGILGHELAVDLVVLGMGEDGHTASLFPAPTADGVPKNGAKVEGGTSTATEWVIAAEAPPTSPIARRVTFSYAAIARSHRLIALVTGASKAARLRQVLLEEGTLPMQRVVRERSGKTLFIVDNAAASLLLEAERLGAANVPGGKKR